MTEKEILEKSARQNAQDVWFILVLWVINRPVESFNLGKKGEHKERVKFDEYASCCKR